MAIECHHIRIEGRVQGVGFRPFVYQLASELALQGWVRNIGGSVEIAIQGQVPQVQHFIQQLSIRKPAQAIIHQLHSHRSIQKLDHPSFEIRYSDNQCGVDPKRVTRSEIAVDLSPCDACLEELFDPLNRRYGYPFSHCTECGPRYSVLQKLPYDRANTTLRSFPLCRQCLDEYRNPSDRRFHAEAIACPDCGPQLRLLDAGGQRLVDGNRALNQAVKAIQRGQIVAMKSIGGYQLLADASSRNTVMRLRQRKNRPAKPFAMLFNDLQQVLQHCQVSNEEQKLLLSPQRPIVLLRKNSNSGDGPAAEVAPNVPCWGVMLPCSPLHYLLMAHFEIPLVATSGNLAGEPICIDDDEAVERLSGIADFFLTHNRPIARQLDDTVIRVIARQPCLLRLGRGYAPLSLPLPSSHSMAPMLAVGGHLKNALALGLSGHAHLSQHIGDLDSRQAIETFEQTIEDLCQLYNTKPEVIVHDQHPDYASSHWAHAQVQTQATEKLRLNVQHHVAHFFSCMAEHNYRGPALGISWDGTGYSDDGIIRGGECLYWDGAQSVTSMASLQPFPLPGAEQAIREPRRQAAGLLYSILGEQAFYVCPALWQLFTTTELFNLKRMLESGVNTPMCSSVGRLFDAVAALLGLASRQQFEGQAAMALEACAQGSKVQWHLPFDLVRQQPDSPIWTIDWQPMIRELIESIGRFTPRAELATAFHNTLARIIVEVSHKGPEVPVFLSGGVFQNRRLTETATALLRSSKRSVQQEVFIQQNVPPNDGGLSLGQLYFAQAVLSSRPESG